MAKKISWVSGLWRKSPEAVCSSLESFLRGDGVTGPGRGSRWKWVDEPGLEREPTALPLQARDWFERAIKVDTDLGDTFANWLKFEICHGTQVWLPSLSLSLPADSAVGEQIESVFTVPWDASGPLCVCQARHELC